MKSVARGSSGVVANRVWQFIEAQGVQWELWLE